MKAFLSKRAARAADRIDERWRNRADDPGIFAREFLEAIQRLEMTEGVFMKSNAITEGLHNKMEVISRRAYGFRNFQNYRLRVRALCG